MRSVFASAILASVPSVDAAAQDIGPAGTYRRLGAYEQIVKLRAGREPGRFSGVFRVATKGCVGEVEASGRASKPQEIVFTKVDDGGGTCRIVMRFGADFRTAAVSESDCLFWHGTACSFDGNLKRAER